MTQVRAGSGSAPAPAVGPAGIGAWGVGRGYGSGLFCLALMSWPNVTEVLDGVGLCGPQSPLLIPSSTYSSPLSQSDLPPSRQLRPPPICPFTHLPTPTRPP